MVAGAASASLAWDRCQDRCRFGSWLARVNHADRRCWLGLAVVALALGCVLAANVQAQDFHLYRDGAGVLRAVPAAREVASRDRVTAPESRAPVAPAGYGVGMLQVPRHPTKASWHSYVHVS